MSDRSLLHSAGSGPGFSIGCPAGLEWRWDPAVTVARPCWKMDGRNGALALWPRVGESPIVKRGTSAAETRAHRLAKPLDLGRFADLR